MQTVSYKLSASYDHRSYETRREALLAAAREIDPFGIVVPTSLIEMTSHLDVEQIHDRIRRDARLLADDFLYVKDDEARKIKVSGPYSDCSQIESVATRGRYSVVGNFGAMIAALLAASASQPKSPSGLIPAPPVAAPRSFGISSTSAPLSLADLMPGIGARKR